MEKKFLFPVIAILSLFIQGCVSPQNASEQTKGALVGGAAGAVLGGISSVGVGWGAAEGAIFGGALGAYIEAHTPLVGQLENRGVKIIVLGDYVLLILPSEQIFSAKTSNLQPDAYSTLNKVAELISGYPNMSVKIAAYMRLPDCSEIANQAISQEQANAVEKYLWSRGIDTRLLLAQGYGSAHPVTSNRDDGFYDEQNNRIEMTLQKLPN